MVQVQQRLGVSERRACRVIGLPWAYSREADDGDFLSVSAQIIEGGDLDMMVEQRPTALNLPCGFGSERPDSANRAP